VVGGVTLALLAGGEWALQAAALGRPAAAELELVRTLHALAGVHRSQATLQLDGHRYRAACTQAWYPHRRVAQVVTRQLGVAEQVGNRLVAGGPLVAGAFELAGCPRPLLRQLSSELVTGATVKFERSKGIFEVTLHPNDMAVDVYVAPSSHLPVLLRLSDSELSGTSHVEYGARR
jgi:hypothetical protein